MNKKLVLGSLIISTTAINAVYVDVDLTNYSDKQVTVSLFDSEGNNIIEPTQVDDRDSINILGVQTGEYTFQVTYMGMYQTVAGISVTDSANIIDEESNDFYIDTDLKVKPEAEEEAEPDQPAPPSSPVG